MTVEEQIIYWLHHESPTQATANILEMVRIHSVDFAAWVKDDVVPLELYDLWMDETGKGEGCQ